MSRKAAPLVEAPSAKLARYDAADSTAFPLHCLLHRDILSIVLAALPAMHRLRVASRVCKQWRSVVISTTTAYTLYTRNDELVLLDSAIAMLSSLRHLELRFVSQRTPYALRLPSALVSLTLYAPGGLHSSFPSPPNGLTHLEVHMYGDLAAISELVAASALTLQSLCLKLGSSAEHKDVHAAPLNATLRTVSMPALRHLRLDTQDDEFNELDVACLVRNAQHLTSLHLGNVP